MWTKSNIPTTILPPNYHPQVVRPPKKRKRSAGEDIPMVRNNKLSRRSQTVTYVLCKTKGHNRRSCKGPAVPKGNNTTAKSRRGASASTVKGSASGSKAATQKGNKSSASVKVAASGSKAPQKGNKTAASGKGAASGLKEAAEKGKKTVAASGKGSSQATQPSGNAPKKQPKKK
ncbi:hypothetical protein Tco_0087083 [Tanacetum coccineum]